jgi:hypothetical protein
LFFLNSVFFSHPYIRVVADGNAIAENSPESFAQLCDDIKNRDTSLLVGIDVVKNNFSQIISSSIA